MFDANILFSYMASQDPTSPIMRCVDESHAKDSIVIVAPRELFEEMRKSALKKKYILERKTHEQLEILLTVLESTFVLLPHIAQIPAITRDPKDDYLLAYANRYGVDYLVTGDGDLLSKGEYKGIMILTAAEYCQVLTFLDANESLTSA